MSTLLQEIFDTLIEFVAKYLAFAIVAFIIYNFMLKVYTELKSPSNNNIRNKLR